MDAERGPLGGRPRRGRQPARLGRRRRAATGPGTVGDRAERMDAWVTKDASLKDALATMLQWDAGWVAVLDGDKFLGVLTPATLHEALRRSVGAEEEGVALDDVEVVLDRPPAPDRPAPCDGASVSSTRIAGNLHLWEALRRWSLSVGNSRGSGSGVAGATRAWPGASSAVLPGSRPTIGRAASDDGLPLGGSASTSSPAVPSTSSSRAESRSWASFARFGLALDPVLGLVGAAPRRAGACRRGRMVSVPVARAGRSSWR